MADKLRILIADDHPLYREGLRRVIESKSECEVIAEAGDGESALESIRQLGPDVAILDIGMPKMDGIETCRRIRKEFGSGVFVVAMTGWGSEEDKHAALHAGFDAHLTKPPEPEEFMRLLAGP